MNDLDYLRLSKPQKLLHNFGKLLKSLPRKVGNFFMGIVLFFWKIIKGVANTVADVVMTYIRGDWKTKVSYTVMGFGSCARGQWLRGLLFFVFQTLFNLYLFVPFLRISDTSFQSGLGVVAKLPTLGTQDSTKINGVAVYGDNSFLILLYGVLTLFFIAAFLYTWYVNIKQNKISEEILRSGKALKSAKDDMQSLLDNQFHKTLLALPTAGVVMFTILPIIFMVLIAFTNYDSAHQPPEIRFSWVGLQNFKELLPTSADETAIEIPNVSDHPSKDGSKIMDVIAKNGDKFSMIIAAEDAALIDQAKEAIKKPPTEFPLELTDADGYTLESGRATRSNANPVLTLANGNVLTLTCKPAGHSDLIKLVGQKGLTIRVDWDGSTGALNVTAQDGTSVSMEITKVSEAAAKDVEADMAFAYLEEQALSVSSVANADGTVEMTINNTDGKTIIATIAAEDAENAAKAVEIAATGTMDVDKVVVELTDDAGKVTGRETQFTLYFTGEDEEQIVISPVKARETSNGTISFRREDGFTVTLHASQIIIPSTPSMSLTFRQVLMWTLIWAFFATFLNYFLGMLVAIMINKKGIKFKKLWRTVLVMTIAIPQFISLLYVSKMFASDGLVNGTLMSWGWITKPLPFWTDATWAKCTIIGINIWIGIPYLMLIATGILMNIPADLYESARIDGANAFQTYMKITLPYMLFVTGPYLLTSFTGNINNFNVIFLLSQGKPTSMELMANAGNTDLLITWLYKMTVNDSNYKMAAVLGILVFVVCAVINLIVYNMIPSVKNEEDFQ